MKKPKAKVAFEGTPSAINRLRCLAAQLGVKVVASPPPPPEDDRLKIRSRDLIPDEADVESL